MVEQTAGTLNADKSRIRPNVPGALRAALLSAVLLTMFAEWSPAHANNYGEDGGWQFQSSTDAGNLAAVQDMIQKKQAGGYSNPPSNTYITNTVTTIGHQTNCTVTASALGNTGSTSALASSPSTSGAAATSLANSTSNSSTPGYNSGTATQTGTQSNTGTLGSSLNGSTYVTAQGGNYQALNTTQSNGASQIATVKGSTACAYGALN